MSARGPSAARRHVLVGAVRPREQYGLAGMPERSVTAELRPRGADARRAEDAARALGRPASTIRSRHNPASRAAELHSLARMQAIALTRYLRPGPVRRSPEEEKRGPLRKRRRCVMRAAPCKHAPALRAIAAERRRALPAEDSWPSAADRALRAGASGRSPSDTAVASPT